MPRRITLASSFKWLGVLASVMAALLIPAQEVHDEDEIDVEDLRNIRRESKLWFTKNTNLFGTEIPLSPVTLFTLLLVIIHTYLNWGTYSWCEASHILLKGHDDETINTLRKWKKEIGNDAGKFAELAKRHSVCPSGSKGGSLGRFYRGDMAKNFDKASFDANMPLRQAIGPIETSFGWHLLFIHDRKM